MPENDDYLGTALRVEVEPSPAEPVALVEPPNPLLDPEEPLPPGC